LVGSADEAEPEQDYYPKIRQQEPTRAACLAGGLILLPSHRYLLEKRQSDLYCQP
jgi:hypothetical protein